MTERPIIVGVDGTSTALRAVAWAAEEARVRGRPLLLVHAAPYLGTPDDPLSGAHGRAEAVLAQARGLAHRMAPELGIDTAVLPDPPVAALIDASADAELLVIGMIGGADNEVVLGSVTVDITTAAHCPVTVVRGGAGEHARHAPVLLGVESVEADEAAVTVAFNDAARHGTGVVVVHVPGRAEHLAGDVTAVRERLTPWRYDHPGVAVTVRTGQGNPGVALLHESTDARHIVLGTRGQNAAVRAILGSVSRFVLRHSLVPVTVVPRSLSVRRACAVPAALSADPHDRSQLW
jgi:nucleotide-binding universal stress UspA family protein